MQISPKVDNLSESPRIEQGTSPGPVLVANVNATSAQVAIKNSTIITAIKTEPIKEFSIITADWQVED